MSRTRLAALLAVCLIARASLSARGEMIIGRNEDDCAFPGDMALNSFSFYPNTNYFARGNSVAREPDGGYLVVNDAGFTIKYYSTYKVVTNTVVGETYVLSMCGTQAPNVPGKRFAIPLQSAAADDASAAEFVVQMVMMDRIAYASELAVASCLQSIMACGYVAPDPSSDPDRANAIVGTVDAFWTYGKSSNPKSIAFSAVTATSPLERAEWHKYTAAFYNKEWQANAHFIRIRNAYNALKRDADKAAGANPRTVCWVLKDWDKDFAFSYAPYKVAYVQDAGGRMPDVNVLKGAQLGGVQKGSAIVLKDGSDNLQGRWAAALNLCDVIIDESYNFAFGGLVSMSGAEGWLAQYGLPASFASTNIKAVRNGQVYSLAGTSSQTITRPGSWSQGSVGIDWFERGVSRCDEVLKDMTTVITPNTVSEGLSGWKLRWLFKLDSGTPTKLPATCNLITAKLDAQCKRVTLAARVCPNAVRNCDTGKMEYPALSKRCTAVANQNKAVRLRRRNGLKPDCL